LVYLRDDSRRSAERSTTASKPDPDGAARAARHLFICTGDQAVRNPDFSAVVICE